MEIVSKKSSQRLRSMNVSMIGPALGWILVRPGVVCGVVKDKVRFHCHLCLKDMTELSREEKHIHLHSYHRDETVLSGNNIHMESDQEWNLSLQTKDDLSGNCMDSGSLRGDGHNLEVEEGVGKKSSTDCEQCGKKFKSRIGLKYHINNHKGVRDYKCNICEADYTTAAALSVHKIAKHSARQIFKCPECGKEFPYKGSLVIHRKIHTGEKKHHCRYCNKKFRLSIKNDSHFSKLMAV